MDLLIDLIIWTVKQFANSGKQGRSVPTVAAPRVAKQPIHPDGPPPVPRGAQARAVATAKAVRPAAWSEVPAKWLSQPRRPPVASVTAPPAPGSSARRVERLSGLRVPLILGEVLASPLALREDQI